MQSSALHLPRCIDAIYESNCVTCKNTSPNLLLTSWTSNETRGGGGQEIGITPEGKTRTRWVGDGRVFRLLENFTPNKLKSAFLNASERKQMAFPSKSASKSQCCASGQNMAI